MSAATQSRTIGASIPRLEDDRLLRGHGAFIDDLPEPPGTVHLAFVLSPHPHARIVSLDTAAARGAAGVAAVLTGCDLAAHVKPMAPDRARPGLQAVARPAIADGRVRFAGEIVAAVAASSRYAAEDAAALVRVAYDPLPAIVTMDAAEAAGAPCLHESAESNVLFRRAFKSAGVGAAFTGAALVVRDRFVSHRLAVVSIEPRGCLAIGDPGRGSVTLWTPTQIPHIARTALAEVLGCDERLVNIIAPDAGGGFGMKGYVYPEEVIATHLARHLGVSVKWISDRREDLLTSTQARDHEYEMALAFSGDGTLVAMEAQFRCNLGAYPPFPFGAATEAGGAAIYPPGPYRFQHYAVDTRAVVTNTCPTGVYRGVAAPAAAFATEALMDRAAHRLGLDPAEIRLRNILKPEEFPYTNAANVIYDCGSHERALRRALEVTNYAGFRKWQPKDRLIEGKYRGVGIGCVVEHSAQGAERFRARGIVRIPGFDGALVRIEPDGTATVRTSSASQGQGHHTVFAQIAADVLGLDLDAVAVVEGDTSAVPFGTGTFGSRSAVAGGGAVLGAATQVAAKVRRIAAHLLEAAEADIVLEGGVAHVVGIAQARIDIAKIARTAYSLDDDALPPGEGFGLEATEYYDPPHITASNATHVAMVAIDPASGLVDVERYVAVHDCGRVINPLIVEGQIAGAIIQGMSSVLWEAMRHDPDGQPLTTTLMDYLVATSAGVPDIEVLREETWSKQNAGGFKGAGEGGVIGALPAIANAVADALAAFGTQVTRLPLRPEAVLDLIHGAKAPAPMRERRKL